jgi:2-aminoethylphosphonate-pyruvate transaminase
MQTMVREAVILAAGRGVRLGAMGRQMPKGFIRLGEQPIVEESIARLRDAGIARITIVTGHLAGFYEELAARHAGFVATVHNPDFATTGSLASLLAAADRVAGDVLLLESDIIYESRALDAILAHKGMDVLLLSGRTQSGDEVWVERDASGRLRGISKDAGALGAIAGELVGITRLSAACLAVLAEEGRRLAAANAKAEYESGLVAASARHPIFCHCVDDLVWGEIDDERHLARAVTQIYPRLRGGLQTRNT